MPMKASPSPTTEWTDEELDSSLVILADSVRRHLLRQLSQGNGNVATIDELCDGLPTDGTEKSTGDEVLIALSHVHLPMLSAAGIVEVDWKQETVRYRNGHRIEFLLGPILATAEA
ncbi:DUF7344 domain-containing protein [Natronococcus wangiae]|uniref:DUF7344 domain-containing protein n=1 Tax=Natronococcus wangiae TaxID=3068275 RepID=UPI00273EC250|nr:hypothetical protein [Natronococcus sp. AD5]